VGRRGDQRQHHAQRHSLPGELHGGFFAVNVVPQSVASDGTLVYLGDTNNVWVFDPVANTLANMSDTGLVNGAPTAFGAITALAADTLGHVFAADATHMWSIAGAASVPTITSLAPTQAPESSTVNMTITGSNFTSGSLVVSTCPPSRRVMSPWSA